MSVQQYHDIAIESENITDYRSLKRGDQIAVGGEGLGIEYYHHGIFLGHEKGIADFGGANAKEAKVRCVDILHFNDFGRRTLVRINYPNSDCLPPEIVAQNAEKLIANPGQMGEYDLLSNNCEHFATKCKTGNAVSHQVIEKIRELLRKALQLINYAAVSSSGSLSSGSSGSGPSAGSSGSASGSSVSG